MTASHTRSKARLAERIFAARKRSGLSQERLAAKVGTSRRHVIRWENAEHRPSADYIERIAEATGESVDFFAGDEEDEEADLSAGLMRELRQFVRREMRRATEKEPA